MNVVPDAVNASSISLDHYGDDGGDGRRLRMAWAPVTNVNYGNVSYQIKIVAPDLNDTEAREIGAVSFHSFADFFATWFDFFGTWFTFSNNY